MTQTTAPVLFAPFLLATDGSPSARLAQKLLTAIAQATQAEHNGNGRSLITVLTVQPRRSSRSRRHKQEASASTQVRAVEPEVNPEAAVPSRSVSSDVTDAANSTAIETDFAATIQASFPANLPLSIQTRQGRPAIEILNCARTIRAGLIAVGSRGTSDRRGRLMGSVSAVIARYAPCSVLVAHGTIVAPEEPRLHHILLVVNEAPATQHAIATTRQLVPAGVQQITILYAQPPLNAEYLFGPFATPTPSWQLNRSLQSAQREQSESILQETKAALSLPDVDVQTLRQIGEPGPLICQIAEQRQVDMIVLSGNVLRRWLSLPSSEALFPLQLPRRSKLPDAEAAQQLPVLRNTRLSAAEDYTIHHAPCSVLLCRANQTISNK